MEKNKLYSEYQQKKNRNSILLRLLPILLACSQVYQGMMPF